MYNSLSTLENYRSAIYFNYSSCYKSCQKYSHSCGMPWSQTLVVGMWKKQRFCLRKQDRHEQEVVVKHNAPDWEIWDHWLLVTRLAIMKMLMSSESTWSRQNEHCTLYTSNLDITGFQTDIQTNKNDSQTKHIRMPQMFIQCHNHFSCQFWGNLL